MLKICDFMSVDVLHTQNHSDNGLINSITLIKKCHLIGSRQWLCYITIQTLIKCRKTNTFLSLVHIHNLVLKIMIQRHIALESLSTKILGRKCKKILKHQFRHCYLGILISIIILEQPVFYVYYMY